ncbi:MAG: hypothetical protein QM639_17965 [Rhodocyclaceae bacterium]
MTFQLRFKTLFVHVAMAMCGAAFVAPQPADAATSKNSKSAAPAKKPAAPKSKSAQAGTPKSKSAPSKATGKSTKATSAKSATPSSAKAGQCRTVRVKTSKGMRNQRVCNTPAPEPAALQKSPIKENALSAVPAAATAAGATELKARTVPDRAYAVDGETFFHQGRKYRLQGIPPGALAVGGEHAKQKLQMMLDSGNMTVEPVDVDASGVATAVVRINGRDVVDTLGRDVPRSMRANAASSAPGPARTAAQVRATPAASAPAAAEPARAAVEQAPVAAETASSSSSSEWPRGPVFEFEPGDGMSPGAMGD